MKSQKKISKVMREFKAGTLNTGSKSGPIVKNPKQAIAIALNQARGLKKGGKIDFTQIVRNKKTGVLSMKKDLGKSKPRRYAEGGEVATPPIGTADLSGGASQQTADSVAAAKPQQETSSPYYSPNDYGKSPTGANPAMGGGLNVQNRMTGANTMSQGYAKGGMVKKKPMAMKKGGSVLCRGGGMVMRSRPTKVF
jgi:hypothetical protein